MFNRNRNLMLLAILGFFWLNGCGLDLKELASQTVIAKKDPKQGPNNQDDGLVSDETEEDNSTGHILSFVGKLVNGPELSGSISAIGTNGRRSYLYFGSREAANKVLALELASGALSLVDAKVKGKSHDKDGRYDAASSRNSVTKNPADKTIITSIVAGPGDSAVFSLTGLIHRHGGVVGTAANGGILEINKNVVSGVWGNVWDSLNSGDGKEISSVAVLKDSWIAFSKDKNSFGGNRKFGDKLDEAKEGPTGPKGDAIGTIITASLGAGTDLYVAYDGFVKLRKAESITQICEIDLGDGALELVDIAKPRDLQIIEGGSDIIVISALALLGRKLLIGMSSYSQNGGGVAVVDLSNPAFTVTRPPRSQSGFNVTHIAPSQDGRTALISTDGQGLLFYVHKKFIEISDKTIANLTSHQASATEPLVLKGIEDATTAGLNWADMKIGAVSSADYWYIASDKKGVFKFKHSKESK